MHLHCTLHSILGGLRREWLQPQGQGRRKAHLPEDRPLEAHLPGGLRRESQLKAQGRRKVHLPEGHRLEAHHPEGHHQGLQGQGHRKARPPEGHRLEDHRQDVPLLASQMPSQQQRPTHWSASSGSPGNAPRDAGARDATWVSQGTAGNASRDAGERVAPWVTERPAARNGSTWRGSHGDIRAWRGWSRPAPERPAIGAAEGDAAQGPATTGTPTTGTTTRGPPGPPPASKMSSEPPKPAAAPKFGHLIIKCVKGIELKAGSGMFGKADPYCKIVIGAQEFSTRPHKAGGKNPVWNEEHAFEISSEKEAMIEVFDKENVGQDKFMGELKVNIMDWVANGSFKGDLEILDKSGNGVGKIFVAVKFERPGAAGAGPGLSAGPAVATGARPAGAPKSQGTRDPNSKFTDDEIWEAFVAFDLDKNKFVGAAEIRHVLVNIGEQVTDDEVDEMIRMVDKDGDGQVSFNEFYEMVTGGNQPPPGLGGVGGVPAAGGGGSGGTALATTAPLGQNVVQQRNKKKQALDDFARDNNIKPESIKKAYKRFQATEKDSTGMIDYTEFCEIMQVDPSPQCEGLFQLFDVDRSGQIDVREFMISLTNFAGASKDDKLKFAFMIFDEDGNGVITKQELARILKANHMAQSEAEVARKTDTIMAQADKDGDGVVTFDEFVIVCKKFPNILFPSTGK
eukprot:g3502.t1